MRDYLTLLSTRGLRRFWLGLALDHLGSWAVIAALPILVAERFGIGTELVLSIALRLLPRIVLAPFTGVFLRRFGARPVAAASTAAVGLLTFAPPWCESFLVLQVVILITGTLDGMNMPALHLMRAEQTPKGLELAGNTLFQSAGQLAKLLGPLAGGIAIAVLGTTAAFALFGATLLLAGLVIVLSASPARTAAPPARLHPLAVIGEFRDTLRRDRLVANTLVLAVLYLVMLGGMRPFLFWANAEWYGGSPAAWTALLAAQGLGSLIGAMLCGALARALQRAMSVYELSLVFSLVEGASHFALVLSGSAGQAIAILLVGSIFEMVANVAYFTLIQQRLSQARQAGFYSLSTPMFDLAYALGVASAGAHAIGALGLAAFWLVLSVFSTLPAAVLLALHLRAGRVEPAPVLEGRPQSVLGS
jgi:predicted MFS family arabinose efflux permease